MKRVTSNAETVSTTNWTAEMISDDEIVDRLTNSGGIPLARIFLVNETIYIWSVSMSLFVTPSFPDPILIDATKDYLRRHNRAFASLASAKQHLHL